ncbi:tryptophan synthase subunit beta [Lysinibacillus sphaericus CBAM5]|uniref:Tryptophan synthase subunit beta n=1 Tax=Lysinibacillus sphaericus CBAM5 TaxID=1400869 RepID=W7RTM7_LYSSH|nr:tryptophan synthase subunit beta [Lysinibacillus sphaericus CBAM5]PIJ95677.1 tryptophan synthase subunit beta [Lysinibacillus sphaericus]
MDFRAALLQCKADWLPVIGVRKRASIANKGGTTVTRPFYRGLEWLFFMKK